MLTSFFMGLIVGFFIGVVFTMLWPTQASREWDRMVGAPDPEQPQAEAQDKPKEYAVAGTPRRVPWSIRRKELEAKHRTKRQRMEEWS